MYIYVILSKDQVDSVQPLDSNHPGNIGGSLGVVSWQHFDEPEGYYHASAGADTEVISLVGTEVRRCPPDYRGDCNWYV